VYEDMVDLSREVMSKGVRSKLLRQKRGGKNNRILCQAGAPSHCATLRNPHNVHKPTRNVMSEQLKAPHNKPLLQGVPASLSQSRIQN
jgi:hypothetical protein